MAQATAPILDFTGRDLPATPTNVRSSGVGARRLDVAVAIPTSCDEVLKR